jgi:hypothetical protein
MRHDLVPEEIEIDPFIRRAAFPAAEQANVESTRLGEVVHGEGEVKTRACHVGQDSKVRRERS